MDFCNLLQLARWSSCNLHPKCNHSSCILDPSFNVFLLQLQLEMQYMLLKLVEILMLSSKLFNRNYNGFCYAISSSESLWREARSEINWFYTSQFPLVRFRLVQDMRSPCGAAVIPKMSRRSEVWACRNRTFRREKEERQEQSRIWRKSGEKQRKTTSNQEIQGLMFLYSMFPVCSSYNHPPKTKKKRYLPF